MARSDPFDGLSEFLAIARYGSFRAAANELGVTSGAVSQAVKTLERRLHQPLFNRTTRHVSLTQAGEQLLARLGPAAASMMDALEETTRNADHPAGTLRLLVQSTALSPVLSPVLPLFRRAYPDVRVEVTSDDARGEIVLDGYDAGIRIGEYIDRDMVAVRVSPHFRWVVVGTPAYLDSKGRPQTLEDIQQHECLRYRRPNVGDVSRWEFVRNGQALSIEPPGSVIVNSAWLLRDLAASGMGLAYISSLRVADDLKTGRLETVLEAYSPAEESLFVYYPRTSRNQPKLRAFIEVCRQYLRRSEVGR